MNTLVVQHFKENDQSVNEDLKNTIIDVLENIQRLHSASIVVAEQIAGAGGGAEQVADSKMSAMVTKWAKLQQWQWQPVVCVN